MISMVSLDPEYKSLQTQTVMTLGHVKSLAEQEGATVITPQVPDNALGAVIWTMEDFKFRFRPIILEEPSGAKFFLLKD